MAVEHAEVPVTEGSSSATSLEVGPFRVTHARFPARSTIPPHVHDRACVAVMLAGSFDLRFPGRASIACEPGTMAVEPVGDCHCNIMGTHGASVLVVQPDPGATESLRQLASFLDGIREVREAGLPAVARRIATELAQPDAFTPIVIEGLALQLLAGAARAETGDCTRRAPPWLARAESMLRSHVGEGLTVAGVARECHVHPAHLARAFRAHYRCSVGEYRRRCRIDWAARELSATTAPIADIAARAGFADQSHFTRRFREQVGATPHRWRLIHSR